MGGRGEGFEFANERPRHVVHLPGFRFASRLVRNAEFLVFMNEGGYQQPEFWSEEGFRRMRTEGWAAPAYWEKRPGRWWAGTLAGPRPVRMDEPVCHVSRYEAEAFASWAGARLPSEGEWESVASVCPLEGNFLESDLLHPAPAPNRPPNAKSEGPSQIFGDVWEWTSSGYHPYPSGGLSSGKNRATDMGHTVPGAAVARGGSCATPRSHMRVSYRYPLPPWARAEFVGIRLARDL